uniref:TNFR-Cys domain-containing protein n=1 Tax=Arion vulgaris TaxID=1028688 RepID=A0A0B7A0K5_9EUPU
MLIFVCFTICQLILSFSVCKATPTRQDLIDHTICPNGSFYAWDYEKCVPCSTCDVYSTIYSTCNSTSDTVCVRCTDTTQPDILNHPACQRCPACNTGEYMETACTDNTSTVCLPCPEGTFSYLPSYRTHCFPCTSCINRVTIRDCSTSLNTECGPCLKGYFKDSNRNRCYRCASCAPGQAVVEECKNGRPGKLCSEHYFMHTQNRNIPVKDQIFMSTSQQIITQTTTLPIVSSTVSVLETSSLTAVDIAVFLIVTLLIVTLIILIVWLRSLLNFPSKKLTIHGDDNDKSILHLKDNHGYIDELIDS